MELKRRTPEERADYLQEKLTEQIIEGDRLRLELKGATALASLRLHFEAKAVGLTDHRDALLRENEMLAKEGEQQADRIEALEADAVKLREALLETAEGNAKSDGLPCWCGSPNYHREGRAVPMCLRLRAALGTGA